MPPRTVLMKHTENHGDNPEVEPVAVPYEAFRDLWSKKGWKLHNALGEPVDEPEQADPLLRDQLLAERAEAEDSSRSTSRRARAASASTTSQEG